MPNSLSLIRLACLPVIVLCLSYEGRLGSFLAALFFGMAFVTDFLDGYFARRYGAVTVIGKMLDPLADKILMTTAYLILAFRGALPWWLTILVLSRDVAIVVTTLVISLVAGYQTFPPTSLGKLSTVFQTVAVFAAVSHEAGILYVTELFLNVCIYLATAFTLASGIHYIVVVRQRYGYAPTPPRSSSTGGSPPSRQP